MRGDMRSEKAAADCFGESVEVESLGTRVPVFVAGRRSHQKLPGLLICPEIWGLTPHIKKVVQRFAARGYIACAPEIMSRHGSEGRGTSYSERLKINAVTPEEDMVADCRAALQYLRALPAVNPTAIATVGFSMGGRLAGVVAATTPDIFACVIFYGHITEEQPRPLKRTWVLDLVPRLSCPTLLLYGGADEWNPSGRIELLRKCLSESGLPFEFVLYQDAGHSFFNDEGKTHHPEAAADAWNKVLDFLARHEPGP